MFHCFTCMFYVNKELLKMDLFYAPMTNKRIILSYSVICHLYHTGFMVFYIPILTYTFFFSYIYLKFFYLKTQTTVVILLKIHSVYILILEKQAFMIVSFIFSDTVQLLFTSSDLVLSFHYTTQFLYVGSLCRY